jgi:TnpA family transposase
MLGFRFCPRLRDLPDRKLACIEPASNYKDLQPLLGQRVKADVVREHWEEAIRLFASLKAGTVAPSTMLKKLAAYRRQNQLDLALQELGRIERTLFMLDWLESPELRRRCHAGLNRSEQRHFLAQVICTFKQGRIADRGMEAQQFRASVGKIPASVRRSGLMEVARAQAGAASSRPRSSCGGCSPA